MDYALSSIIGKRDNQEDYGLITGSTPSGAVLAVIADGMGGQVAGEVASSSTVKGFVESFSSNSSKNLPLKLNVALDKANRTLAKSISTNPKLHGMGATLIAAHITQQFVSWVSVGDSILYLYRDKKLHRLNVDHSMMPLIQDSVRRGKITQEEARAHPHRNALRSALTGEEIPLVDLREEPYRLKKDDLILLATDGILTLSESEISQVLERCKGQSAKSIADHLLSVVAYQNKPRQDNTLVEVIKVSASQRTTSKWTDIVIAALIFVMAVVLASVALENKDSVLKAVGLAAAKQETPEPVTPVSPIKVTPIALEDPQQTPDRKQVAQSMTSESTVTSQSVSTGSSTKNSKTSASDKRSAASAKNGKIAETKGISKIDSPKSTITDASTSPASVTKPASVEDTVETAATVKPPTKNEVTSKDGDKDKQLLDSDHTSSSKAEPN
jgi:serine/threonine protein phosphatase PrpC